MSSTSLEDQAREHLSGERSLADEDWQKLLSELARDLPKGGSTAGPLVRRLLLTEPDRIDRHLSGDDAERVLTFMLGESAAASCPHRDQIGLAVLDFARELHVQPERKAPETTGFWEKVRRALRPMTLVAAGAVGGFLLGVMKTEHALFLPRSVPTGPNGVAISEVPLQASIWLDRTDGRYTPGSRASVGYRVNGPSYAAIVEMDPTGQLRFWQLPAESPGTCLEAQRTYGYPAAGKELSLPAASGRLDLLLLAASRPLPEGTLADLLAGRVGPGAEERQALRETIRTRLKTWAKPLNVALAFANAEARIGPP